MISWFTNLWSTFKTSPLTAIGGVLMAVAHYSPQLAIPANIASYVGVAAGVLLGAAGLHGTVAASQTPASGSPVDISSVDLASQNLIAGVLQTALAQHQANNAPPAKPTA